MNSTATAATVAAYVRGMIAAQIDQAAWDGKPDVEAFWHGVVVVPMRGNGIGVYHPSAHSRLYVPLAASIGHLLSRAVEYLALEPLAFGTLTAPRVDFQSVANYRLIWQDAPEGDTLTGSLAGGDGIPGPDYSDEADAAGA